MVALGAAIMVVVDVWAMGKIKVWSLVGVGVVVKINKMNATILRVGIYRPKSRLGSRSTK